MSGEKNTIELPFERTVRQPTVPNFILLGDGEEKISIGDLTREQLELIAHEWGSALLKRAFETGRARALQQAKEEG